MGRKIKDPKKTTTITFDFDNYWVLRYFMDLWQKNQSETVNEIMRDYALQFFTDDEGDEDDKESEK